MNKHQLVFGDGQVLRAKEDTEVYALDGSLIGGLAQGITSGLGDTASGVARIVAAAKGNYTITDNKNVDAKSSISDETKRNNTVWWVVGGVVAALLLSIVVVLIVKK